MRETKDSNPGLPGTADGTYLDELDAWQAAEPALNAAIKALQPDAFPKIDAFTFHVRGAFPGGGIRVLWANEHPKLIQIVLRDSLNRSVLLTHPSDELTALRARVEELKGCIGELVECAELRGDADLPHPADDPKLWTARMQHAWNEARRIAEEIPAPVAPAGEGEVASA